MSAITPYEIRELLQLIEAEDFLLFFVKRLAIYKILYHKNYRKAIKNSGKNPKNFNVSNRFCHLHLQAYHVQYLEYLQTLSYCRGRCQEHVALDR